MKRGLKTFMLPMQDKQATEFINDPGIVVTLQERYFAAKDGYILLHLQFEDYREKETNYEEDGGLL